MIKASVKYIGGLQFVGHGESGHAVVMDGPAKFGGTDTGPSPMEMLLLGLGGCTGMDTVYVLRKKKQEVTALEINLIGQTRQSEPTGYEEIEIQYVLRGKGLREDAVERAINLSMQKYCSVKASLEGSAKISWSYKIEND